MKVIAGDRRSGKTTELIKMSAESGKRIMCMGLDSARYVKQRAEDMGLDIPEPLSMFSTRLVEGEQVLVDEAQHVIERATGCYVDAISVNADEAHLLGGFAYNFPPIKKHEDMAHQLIHVIEESKEAMNAYCDGEYDLLADELMDVIHCAETALRKIKGLDAGAARERVIEKNDARGYYGC